MIVGVGLLRIDGEDPPILVDRGAHLALGVAHDAEREARIGTIRLAPHHRVELGARRRPLLAGNVDAGQRQARGGRIRLALQGRPQLLDRAVEVTQLPERHPQADARVDQLRVQPKRLTQRGRGGDQVPLGDQGAAALERGLTLARAGRGWGGRRSGAWYGRRGRDRADRRGSRAGDERNHRQTEQTTRHSLAV